MNDKNNRVQFPRGYSKKDFLERINVIKENTDLEISDEKDNVEDMQGIIENQIGFLHMPMGMAGPLLINGDYAKGQFIVPVCTVEGTLTASMSRGMITTSKVENGIITTHLKQEISRAPFFILSDIKKQNFFTKWVKDNFEDIKKVAESTTRYGKLIRINSYNLGNYVILDFIYNTGNAAGQNMVSLATLEACQFIKQKIKFPFLLDSNFASDKKASSITTLRGRGHSVIAEVNLSKTLLRRFLRVEAKDFKEMEQLGPYASSMAGNQGIQLHLSNALSAIYLATGQDVACVAENAIGYTHFKIEQDESLSVQLSMPSITVGTVGGGTRLKQQRRNLEILGCGEGENSSKKLAEIVCASALCLEISLVSAILSEDWVGSHMKYGRTKEK